MYIWGNKPITKTIIVPEHEATVIDYDAYWAVNWNKEVIDATAVDAMAENAPDDWRGVALYPKVAFPTPAAVLQQMEVERKAREAERAEGQRQAKANRQAEREARKQRAEEYRAAHPWASQ